MGRPGVAYLPRKRREKLTSASHRGFNPGSAIQRCNVNMPTWLGPLDIDVAVNNENKGGKTLPTGKFFSHFCLSLTIPRSLVLVFKKFFGYSAFGGGLGNGEKEVVVMVYFGGLSLYFRMFSLFFFFPSCDSALFVPPFFYYLHPFGMILFIFSLSLLLINVSVSVFFFMG